MMLAILLVSLLAISAVNAADNATSDVVSVEETTVDVVKETTDEVVSVENDNQVISANESDWGTFDDLVKEINAVEEGGILNLTKDYKYVNGSNEGIQINKPITIDGQGHTIDGNYLSRIFNITSDNVILKNIRFLNGRIEGDGGAIYWSGKTGTVFNCSFVNCLSSCFSPSASYCYGGAVYWSGDDGVLGNSSFVNCSVSSKATTFYNGMGYLSFSYGGAAYWSGVNGTVEYCSFVNCSVISNSDSSHYCYGGAVYWSGDDGVLSNGNFVNCSSMRSGGAVYWSGVNGVLSNGNFMNNNAIKSGSLGGAVYWNANYGSIFNCNFVNVSSIRGGAICLWECFNAQVSNCSFMNCSAYTVGFSGYGGAICLWECFNAQVSNCSFVNCSTFSHSTDYYSSYSGHGGAVGLYCSNGTLSNCSFLNCSSKNSGGAIYFDTGVWNEYGMERCDCYEILLTDSCFVYCSSQQGNAIYWEYPCGIISNCSFVNCSNSGYAINLIDEDKINNHTLHINNSTFSNNAAIHCFNDEIKVIINNSWFDKNHYNFAMNSLFIFKRISELYANNFSYNYGDVTFNVTLSSNGTALSNNEIIFNITKGNTTETFNAYTNNEGIALLNDELSILDVGTWTISIFFDGYDNYYSYNTTAIITVLPLFASLVIDDINATVGHEVALVVNVSSDLTVNEGYVVFFDGETNIGESPVSGGVATLTYAPASAGEHAITAIFNSTNYLSSNSTAKLLVDSATVDVLVDQGIVGFNSTFVAEVKGLYSTINEGTVTFYINDEYLGIVPVENGTASISYIPLNVNTYTVKAVFGDSDKFLSDEDSVSYTVVPADTMVAVGDMNATVGHEFIINVNVSSSNNLTINEGYVVFLDGSTQIGESNVYGGVAALTYTPSTAGEHTIAAIFNSDNYLSSNSTAKLLVDNATVEVLVNTGTVGYNSTFVANVKGLYSTINEGNVAFYINDEYLGTVPVVNGSASFVYMPLTANTYIVKALFSNSVNFLDDEDTATFIVNGAGAQVIINDFNGTVGHDLTISVNVTSPNNLTINEGIVTFFDGETSIGEASVYDGVATLTYTPATAGNHTITAFYTSENYQSVNASAVLSVAKANVDLGIGYIESVYFTNPSNFAVNVNSNNKPVNEGEIKFYVNNVSVGSSSVYDGIANFDYVANTTGSFILTSVFNETDNYLAANATTYFYVDQMPTTLTGESIIFDEQAYKTFTTELKDNNNNGVNGQPVKIEVIKYSGESATFNGISDSNGITIYDVGNLAGGMWYVTGIYAGDQNYIESRFADKFIVVRMDTTTDIEEIENPKVNHSYKLKANIHDENGKLVKEGIVQFYLDGVDIGSIDLSNNQGHQSALGNGVLGAVNPMFEYELGADSDLYINYVPTKAGKHTLTAVYEGTTIYKSSNSTTILDVSNSNTKGTTITAADVNTVYKGGKYLVATLKDVNGKALSGVKVTVVLNGQTYTPTTNSNGQVKVSTNGLKPVKTYTAKITFAGNSKYDKSSASANVIVKKATPKMTAKAKTFKKSVKTKNYVVTLKTNQNKVMKKAKLTLKVNGKTYSATTNAKGQATFKITKLTKKGKFTGTIAYKGNAYYNKLSKKVQITVK